MRGEASQLLRNALSGGGRHALGAVAALLVTPYALRQLGEARFGLWALAGALIALLRMLDLGIGRSLTREVARADGAGVRDAALPAIQSARFLALLLGGASLLAAWLLRDLVVIGLFDLPASLWPEARFVLVGSVAVAALESAFAPRAAVLDGLGRMDLSNLVDGLVQRLLSPLGVVLVLWAGWGLYGLVFKNLAAAILAGWGYGYLSRQQAPALAAGPARPQRAATRRLLAFGGHIQLVNLATALVEPVAKTWIGRGPGLEALAVYELASRVTAQLGATFMALANALFPAAAGLVQAEPDEPQPARPARAADRGLLRLHRSATRYLAWLVLPSWAILAVLADLFIRVWVGPDQALAASIIRVLTAGWALALLALPAFLIAQAGGAERLSSIAGLCTAGIAIGLFPLTIPRLGVWGAGLAVSAGLAGGGLVALLLFARRFDLGPRDALPLGPSSWLAALLAAGTSFLLAGALPDAWLAGPSMPGLLLLAGCGLAGLLAAALLLLASGEIGAAERALLARLRDRDRLEGAS